jgi:hypothetical protein
MLDQAQRDEAVYGSKAAYVEDYFPHIWEDAAKAREVFKALSAAQNLGPKWFQKERVFDLIEEGIKAGLKLKTTNPEELVSLRLMAGADMRMRMELLQELEKMGLARRVKELNVRLDIGANGGPQLDEGSGFAREGWAAINAPNMEQWLISPDIQPIWENAVESKGLWADEGIAGSAFKKWMAFKNIWVPIKLSISAFHPLHVMHINFNNDMARGLTQIIRGGDFVGGMRSMAGAFDMRQGVGYDARQAWLKPREEQTPFERAIVDLMTDGGFVPQLSEQLRIAGRRSFQKAIDESRWLAAMPLGLRRGLELLQGRIFERWIPGIKAAAYIKEAQALFERRPDLLDDNIQRRVALRAIAKSVDNRFGEMFYGSLFWNRTIKDAGIGSFLSLGWNLGFFREFGGAVIDTGLRFKPNSKPRQTILDATNKMEFALLYFLTGAALAGAMTYAFTGEMPKDDDFTFPRIGGLNPDGSPRRITTMFYNREYPMLMKHIQEQGGGLGGSISGLFEMYYNKTMIQPFREIAQNKDYFGYPLWDESAPLYKKAFQFAKKEFANQMIPMTGSGAARAATLGNSWTDKGVFLSFLGFGPAPSYVEKTAIENHIQHLYGKYVAPSAKPYAAEERDRIKREAKDELRLANQRGDVDAANAARKKAIDAGAKGKYLTASKLNQNSTYFLFSRLPEDIQRQVLEEASPAEVNAYRSYAKAKVQTAFPARPVTAH